LLERLKRFPEVDAASTMREVGVAYVVLHADQPGADGVLAPARASPDFRLLGRFEQDYLFEVVSAGTR
jgi:hypothetical protein